MWFIFEQEKQLNKTELKNAIIEHLKNYPEVKLESLENIKQAGENLPNLDSQLNSEIRIWLPNILY